MTCRQTVALLDAFLDGELAPERMLEVEQHLADCATCMERVRLTESLRVSTQRVARQVAEPSEAFQSRVAAAMAAERQRTAEIEEGERGRFRPGTAWPLAAAATVTLAFSGWLSQERESETDRAGSATTPAPSSSSQPLSAALTVERLLDELVDYHTAPPAPQITEPSLVGRLEPEVGVPLRLPSSLQQFGAQWEGGSVIPMRNQRAAVFRYELSDHPVTVYVYNASRVPLRAALEPRVVRDQPVHVGAHRGYSIAALEQRGVGYAVASDLNGDESAELVASIH